MKKKQKGIRAWGGYTDDKLDTEGCKFVDSHSMRDLHAVFTTRKLARALYEDVRPVLIVELKTNKS